MNKNIQDHVLSKNASKVVYRVLELIGKDLNTENAQLANEIHAFIVNIPFQK